MMPSVGHCNQPSPQSLGLIATPKLYGKQDQTLSGGQIIPSLAPPSMCLCQTKERLIKKYLLTIISKWSNINLRQQKVKF